MSRSKVGFDSTVETRLFLSYSPLLMQLFLFAEFAEREREREREREYVVPSLSLTSTPYSYSYAPTLLGGWAFPLEHFSRFSGYTLGVPWSYYIIVTN